MVNSMNKKLPKVFTGKDALHLDDKKQMNRPILNNRELIIRKKIDNIFKSPSFVYKERVVITTSKGDRLESIIARNNTSILTLSNQVISISEILDIKKV